MRSGCPPAPRSGSARGRSTSGRSDPVDRARLGGQGLHRIRCCRCRRKAGVSVDVVSGPKPGRGFIVQPRRWVVERTNGGSATADASTATTKPPSPPTKAFSSSAKSPYYPDDSTAASRHPLGHDGTGTDHRGVERDQPGNRCTAGRARPSRHRRRPRGRPRLACANSARDDGAHLS